MKTVVIAGEVVGDDVDIDVRLTRMGRDWRLQILGSPEEWMHLPGQIDAASFLAGYPPACDRLWIVQEIEPQIDYRLLGLGTESEQACSPCPACKGSGKYVGLLAVEDCAECDGVGLVLPLNFRVLEVFRR